MASVPNVNSDEQLLAVLSKFFITQDGKNIANVLLALTRKVESLLIVLNVKKEKKKKVKTPVVGGHGDDTNPMFNVLKSIFVAENEQNTADIVMELANKVETILVALTKKDEEDDLRKTAADDVGTKT